MGGDASQGGTMPPGGDPSQAGMGGPPPGPVDPATGQPVMSPMMTPPAQPLPANPRPPQQSYPKTSDQAMREASMLKLLEQKQQLEPGRCRVMTAMKSGAPRNWLRDAGDAMLAMTKGADGQTGGSAAPGSYTKVVPQVQTAAQTAGSRVPRSWHQGPTRVGPRQQRAETRTSTPPPLPPLRTRHW